MATPSFEDTEDFTDADRGFLEALDPAIVTDASGRVIWDNDAYSFLQKDCPDTANPSLWRQGQLSSRQGLFEVTEGIYQVRGLDLSNMTLVEGDRGVIVIDPLISAETAAAALALYRRNRGDRPVTGLIYTHSHGDHFGGARGVVPHGHEPVPVLAPAGFLEHAASENVYAGTAMTRRAVYMYGAQLPKAPDGQIGCGLGMTTSTGTITLIAPTVDITETGQEEVVDGVRIVFHLTPGTEAPAEMNFHFPQRNALCLAENATHNMHNVLTLRGALVRDARVWAHYLDEAWQLFGEHTDVSFASHHWPTWGRERIGEYLTKQRDLYAYVHDQSLRLLNSGLTGPEIAEQITLPPALEQTWSLRGYYGSLSHNVKAVYQRYMGWYDGNPANLWPHPPAEQAARYVELLGGPDATVTRAREFVTKGDLRFAATLLNHAVFADPEHTGAREALAAVYDRLGHGAENGTWRNFYLTAAMELRGTPATVELETANPELAMALTVDQLIDSLAVRVNGPRAWDTPLTVDWLLTDQRRGWRLTLSNGALTHRSAPAGQPLGAGGADLTLTLTKPQLLGLLAGQQPDGIERSGDPQALARLFAVLDTPDPNFAIVTP
ncbi:alkyl sulfatase BDS1-like metallo-beta-lactamase superfamily hydrolase [Kitasatospora gansuensis]|uniref:Alkyl sulfatase BDS1-like metallo-beta-lactamase superfamily hydrolase n=1 Tax=Kitasatospora gansuensis TaxID=258050 RepID=A0A7W7WIN9_9ACTN|nr:alkyl sulfatase dimerization domain-containing protein [Kitasatospora gansuensis]MBB4947729.1 alkyl sulfatase BDS1-like metallo-beta-lactamase superfamily hydrolase [Kitasatospora gansuensis]